MKKYNFNAGPSILPREVIENTAKQILDFNGSGLSLAEISHRAKDFQPVVDEAVALIKEILNVPEGYSVLFLGGGASLEFCMIPYNFLIKKAGYLNTGTWAKKAMKEAKLFGEVVEVASSADAGYTFYPKDYECPADLDYLHITTNNTIYGTEIRQDPDVPVRLIGDMSSDIFSRPVDVAKYDCIYAGAQKNLAMAGVTLNIDKDEVMGKTLRWIKKNGGVEEMDRRAKERADMLYAEIDRNKLFRGTVEPGSRSLMNICFVMNDEYKDLEKPFFEYATSKGMVGIKGHRSVGGFRASCYNALPLECVEALVKCMQEFEAQH